MHISAPPAVINLFGTSSEHFGLFERRGWGCDVKQYKERPISTNLAQDRKSVCNLIIY